MTEDELKILRLRCELFAMRIVVEMVLHACAKSSPAFATSLRQRLQELRLNSAQIALPGLAPQHSDLFAAELQEALDSLLSGIEAGLPKAPH